MAHREKLKEDYREREVDYHKDFQAEDFVEDPQQGNDLKARISEFREVVHGFEFKVRESLAQASANPNANANAGKNSNEVKGKPGQGRTHACILVAAAAMAMAILLAAGMFARYSHLLEMERLRILEDAGSHALCHEERARLQSLLDSAALARFEAEQALARLQAELASTTAATTRRTQARTAAATIPAPTEQPEQHTSIAGHTAAEYEPETGNGPTIITLEE